MLKQVLINVEATDMRVAILEDGALVELFVEDFNNKSILGNIYKGRVEGIVPGLKAVFVNIGLERNAFLHFADILREYELPSKGRPERWPAGRGGARPQEADAETEEAMDEDDYIPPPLVPGEEVEEAFEGPVERAAVPEARSRPLKVGDSILVQVTKEPIGQKGPRITTYLSIPGRYLVYMPNADHQGGVSRKIEDPEERRRLRELLRSLRTESGAFIIRTAGLEESEKAIVEDRAALERIWKEIKRRSLRAGAPALIHNEQEILQRLVRDVLRNDITEVLIDSRVKMKELIKACQAMAPTIGERIHLFESHRNIFDVFQVEQQFQKALRRKVWLKSGGFVVLDETEAMTAIDVNSGKYVGTDDQDEVILKTNLEACRVISRQLRLRDLGGLIVIDFIDMTNREHQQQVLRELKSCLRRDNAKYAMTGFSDFGLVEMTRKRVRMSLSHAIFRTCPYCEGAGRILGESQTWKMIKYALIEELTREAGAQGVKLQVHAQMREYMEKEVAEELEAIARRFGVAIEIIGRPDFHHEQFSVVRQVKSGVDGREPSRTRGAPGGRKKVQKTA